MAICPTATHFSMRFCLLLSICSFSCEAWTSRTPQRVRSVVFAGKEPGGQREDSGVAVLDDDEAPAGIVGAQFFGGNKEKEEFYDPVAEAEAAVVQQETLYDRFADRDAFADDELATMAKSLQSQINNKLHGTAADSAIAYANMVAWSTPLQVKNQSPLRELESAADFYPKIDLAITSAHRLASSQPRLTWELSVEWPTFWAPRVLLNGRSTLTLEGNQIVKQVDDVDQDVLNSIRSQLTPRCWDLYHIGMTPSAELAPRINEKSSPITGYTTYEIPGRLVLKSTQLDLGTRDDRAADVIPNHAFSCVIKTMGPQRQTYVPVSPVQVNINPQTEGPPQLEWTIPLSVAFQSSPSLPLPEGDEETDERIQPRSWYQWESPRRVVSVPYSGSAQDSEVTAVRKKLFEQAQKDGLVPKMKDGRPIFSFVQQSVKACFTEEGLGMAVYEYRPDFVKANEVCLEIET